MAYSSKRAHGKRMLNCNVGAAQFSLGVTSIGAADPFEAPLSNRAHLMNDRPLDLDKHRGMAAQKATDMRSILADVENNARDLRDRQGLLESQLLSFRRRHWPEAAAKARYILTSYAAGLAPTDKRHRDLINVRAADFDRLCNEGLSGGGYWNKPETICTSCRIYTPRHVQDGRVASARGRIRLVQHQGERNVVFGPHDSEAYCLRKIAEIDPPPQSCKTRARCLAGE